MFPFNYKIAPIFFFSIGLLLAPITTVALPPPDDIPEEVLRTEIILEARSPLDGKPLTAEEYALLQEKIGESIYPPRINPRIRHLIALRRLQKFIRIFIPFI